MSRFFDVRDDFYPSDDIDTIYDYLKEKGATDLTRPEWKPYIEMSYTLMDCITDGADTVRLRIIYNGLSDDGIDRITDKLSLCGVTGIFDFELLVQTIQKLAKPESNYMDKLLDLKNFYECQQ